MMDKAFTKRSTCFDDQRAEVGTAWFIFNMVGYTRRTLEPTTPGSVESNAMVHQGIQ